MLRAIFNSEITIKKHKIYGEKPGHKSTMKHTLVYSMWAETKT